MYSDESRSGWGAHLLDRVVSGVSSEQKLLHISLLEMKALFLAMQSFQELVAGRCVTSICDNSTVVAYVNKQGGTVSHSLCSLASQFLRWSESLDVHLDARYLSGQSSALTVLVSRRDQVIGTERPASSLWLAVDRSVRDESQREASPILFPRPGSPGGLRGCVSSSLGQPGPVRFSTLSSGRKGGGSSQRDPQSLHDWLLPSGQRRSGSQTFSY